MGDYLLDTHAFVWWVSEQDRFGPRAVDAITTGRVVVSDVTLWELAVKISAGKYVVDADVGDWFERQLAENRFTPAAIERKHLARVATLPTLHRDPFDRLLISTAVVEGLRLISVDRDFVAYDVDLLDAAT